MPPRSLANDSLWRCLCPGLSPKSLAFVAPRAEPPRRRKSQKCRPRQLPIAHPRAYSTGSPFVNRESFFYQPSAQTGGFQPLKRQPGPLSTQPQTGRPLAHLPGHVLHEHLRTEGARGNFDEVMKICRVLVKDRQERPNKEMYNAILHSFVSSKDGTAGKLRKVLEEMGFWRESDSFSSDYPKIELDARGCECVLEVLAIHPDYLLRAEILDYMKSRWFSLSDRGQNYVVAGLLRERHFEHALETMEDMVRKRAKVENWLFDQAMWILLEYGEVEEAFYVLSLKEGAYGKSSGTSTVKLSDALWGALLDAAAQRQLHEATTMVWTTQVQPGYLKPGTGACLSVLTLASRHGDVQLATDVFRVLTERDTPLTTHHYELLIATYLKADDLSAALSVVLIMADSNTKVDAGTCQPLYSWLSTRREGQYSRPMHAFTLLQEFEAAGRKVPTAAVNACMQASIALNRLEEAIEIYKALHAVSHAGPNTNTFNILFRGCHRRGRKELAMFFANEMIQLGLRPNRITYDRLILVCVQAGDLEDALLYYEEMIAAAADSKTVMTPRRGTWELLIHMCVAQGNETAVTLLKHYEESVEDPRKGVQRAVLNRFEHGTAPDPDWAHELNDRMLSGNVEDRHVKNEEMLTDGVGDRRIRDNRDVDDVGSRQGRAPSQTTKQVGPHSPSPESEERTEDWGDGLAQLMQASKSSKPY